MSDTIVQKDIGRGNMLYHDAKRLDKLPWLGETYTIMYKDGVGQVSDRVDGDASLPVSKDPETSREKNKFIA
ncbi:KfrB domain-containing protein [Glaciimonas immobilis]|uniref:KfrB domain-containing protein n=1 Tax=Glaciimonas immobilis TaxID=728004 RepID=A0A840RZN6_9BURK|nr:hypothetical protein [Glaciimonas immobilis]KAF3995910.1 hypothetical protein HAV38_21440 [Glaciimonas immobilis]MBB5202692.1 hypothetical protein [Glaciimonas immobilis]